MPSFHVCTLENQDKGDKYLPPLPPNPTLQQKMRRWFKKICTASVKNERCKQFFRSRAQIDYECKRHLTTSGVVLIHPFSILRMYWEVWMTVILFLSLILIPINVTFYFYDCYPFDHPISYVMAFLDITCIVDIIFSFNTGYVNLATREVVLSKRKSIINYALGIQFFLDCLTSIPSDIVFACLYLYGPSAIPHQKYIRVLSLFKIFKMNIYLCYMNRVSDLMKLSQNMHRIMWFVLITIIIVHWVALMHLLIPMFDGIFTETFNESYWLHESNLMYLEYDIHKYAICVFRAVGQLWCITHGTESIYSNLDAVMSTLTFSLGYIYNAFLFVMTLQLITSYNASRTKYQCIIDQVHQYMRHKKLPVHMQKKLLTYYEYKFQKRYFREMAITENLSERLLKEINLFACRKLVESVSLFSGLPDNVVGEIIYHLKSEVYLPNDIIVKAGTLGDCMYFLSSGTVAVLTHTGKEICHLQDGAYFGEVALIMKDQKRIATVFAIEICEVYKLDRKGFRTCFTHCADIYKTIEQLAEQRLEKTVIIEELHKKLLKDRAKKD